MEGLMVVKVLCGHAGKVEMDMAGLTLGEMVVYQRAEQGRKKGREKCESRDGKKDFRAQ